MGILGRSWRMAAPLAVLASTGAASPALAGSETIALERSVQWHVNVRDESCIVLTEFGQGAQKIVLHMIFYGLGADFELRVFGKPFRSDTPRKPVTTDFGPVADPVTSTASFGSAGAWRMAIIGDRRLDDFQAAEGWSVAPPPITPEQERAVTWLDVRAHLGKTYRLQTGPMDKVMDVIRACQSEMIRSWGYEPDKVTTMLRGAEPLSEPETWPHGNDYPDFEASKGANAIVRFRLDVSEAGEVTGCHVQEPMNPPTFNELTCGLLMKRARFKPALDRDGKPARDIYRNRVRWIMEN